MKNCVLIMLIDLSQIPVYYINLDSQPDRAKQTEDTLLKLGFSEVNRISAIKHSTVMVGCALSHHKVMSDSAIKTPFILMEDDIVLTNNTKLTYEIPDNTDALYLGNSQWARFLNFSGPYLHYHKVSDEIVQVYNMLTAHAVLYLDDTYRNHLSRIADYSANIAKFHMDVGYAESHRYYNIMALNNPLVAQRGYNYKVTNVSVTDVGREIDGSFEYFERVKLNLNELTKVVDNNNFPSKYNPRWWVS